MATSCLPISRYMSPSWRVTLQKRHPYQLFSDPTSIQIAPLRVHVPTLLLESICGVQASYPQFRSVIAVLLHGLPDPLHFLCISSEIRDSFFFKCRLHKKGRWVLRREQLAP